MFVYVVRVRRGLEQSAPLQLALYATLYRPRQIIYEYLLSATTIPSHVSMSYNRIYKNTVHTVVRITAGSDSRIRSSFHVFCHFHPCCMQLCTHAPATTLRRLYTARPRPGVPPRHYVLLALNCLRRVRTPPCVGRDGIVYSQLNSCFCSVLVERTKMDVDSLINAYVAYCV